MKRLFLLLMLLLPLPAEAATWSWTDASGNMHFTDDLGSVPKKYRAQALQRAAAEGKELEAPPATGKDDVKAATDALPAGGKAVLQGAAVDAATRFGDRTAGEWQTEFRALRAQLKAVEQQREAVKQEGGDGKVLLSSQKIAELNARIKQLNQEDESLRLRFNQLVAQANKAGLPQAFAE